MFVCVVCGGGDGEWEGAGGHGSSLPPSPTFAGQCLQKRLRYSNRAVSNSNRTVNHYSLKTVGTVTTSVIHFSGFLKCEIFPGGKPRTAHKYHSHLSHALISTSNIPWPMLPPFIPLPPTLWSAPPPLMLYGVVYFCTHPFHVYIAST